MKYYLVALFDKRSYEDIELIQKYLSNKYDLYTLLPTLHITMGVIDNPSISKITPILNKIFLDEEKFHVSIKDVICFGEPYKSVNLKVENTGHIKTLCERVYNTLISNGFKMDSNPSTWDLHISLANKNFANREWNEDEYLSACKKIQSHGFSGNCIIEKIELWKPVNNKDEMTTLSYSLK